MNKIPLFSSHYSIGQSILTLEDSLEIKNDYPVSILAIAKKHNLPVYLIDNSFSGFIEAYKNTSKHNIDFRFGIKLCVCDDLTKKDNDSLLTESNIVIWLLNSDGYKDALKIYNQAATEGFYYNPRTDWKNIKDKMTSNLSISIPFYSSFIAKNTLNYKHRAIPDFGSISPIFHVEEHDLPFDALLKQKVLNFGGQIQESHSCYYYKNEDVKAFKIFRCISERTTYEKPELKSFGSDKFSVESFLKDEFITLQ